MRLVLAALALALAPNPASPGVARCPKACKQDLATKLKECEKACPKHQPACRKTCKMEKRSAAADCKRNAAAVCRGDACQAAADSEPPNCGFVCRNPGQSCGSVFVACCDPSQCENGRCCSLSGGTCSSTDDCCGSRLVCHSGICGCGQPLDECNPDDPDSCCPGLDCVNDQCHMPTTTTTTTTTSTTTTTFSTGCTGFANLVPATGELDLSASCTEPRTATEVAFRFDQRTITDGFSPSEGQCNVTSSIGTNDTWLCPFAVGFAPGSTLPFGAIHVNPPASPTVPVTGVIQLHQGPTTVLTFPLVFNGGG